MGLSIALVASALTESIRTGSVREAGLELDVTIGTVDANSRGMLAGRYDVAEMSLASYVMALAQGAQLIALPVFFDHPFLQQCLASSASAPILSPHDMRGKRIAVAQFWTTSAVWLRGLLLHEYGIAAHELEWITTQPERVEQAYAPGVNVTVLSGDPPLQALLDDGTVDAILAPHALPADVRLAFPFEDSVAAALNFRRRTGIYPLCCTVVVRAPLLDARPRLGATLFGLFERSRDRALAEQPDDVPSPLAGLSLAEATAALGEAYPFGRARNGVSLEAFLGYAAEQGLTPRRMLLDETFLDLNA